MNNKNETLATSGRFVNINYDQDVDIQNLYDYFLDKYNEFSKIFNDSLHINEEIYSQYKNNILHNKLISKINFNEYDHSIIVSGYVYKHYINSDQFSVEGKKINKEDNIHRNVPFFIYFDKDTDKNNNLSLFCPTLKSGHGCYSIIKDLLKKYNENVEFKDIAIIEVFNNPETQIINAIISEEKVKKKGVGEYTPTKIYNSFWDHFKSKNNNKKINQKSFIDFFQIDDVNKLEEFKIKVKIGTHTKYINLLNGRNYNLPCDVLIETNSGNIVLESNILSLIENIFKKY